MHVFWSQDITWMFHSTPLYSVSLWWLFTSANPLNVHISDCPWSQRTYNRTQSHSSTFLFVPPGAWRPHRLRQQKQTEDKLRRKTTMKLSIIRSACSRLQMQPRSRVSGLSRRCLPVSPAGGRLILRSASDATNRGTNRKLADNFGKQSRKEDGFECDTSLR